MSQSFTGLRQRRTFTLLRNALIQLIEEKGFEAITVGELTTRAMVSRATFYRHYRDKYDLVEQIFDEALRELLESVSEPGAAHPPQVWGAFFEHIAAYDWLYGALLGPQGSPWFALKMKAALVELVKVYTRPDAARSSDPSRRGKPGSGLFVETLVAAMAVEAIAWWLTHGRPSPPQEMARRCVALASSVIQEAGRW